MNLSRRTFLRAAGVSLALPWLESLRAAEAVAPRRMVFICAPLGLHGPSLFPTKAGRDYPTTPYLDVLGDLRDDMTVISGLSHPDVGPSHDSIFSFLTSAPHPEVRAGFRNTISADQVAAEHFGGATRYPSLVLSCEGFSLSWTRSGALVPSDSFPAQVFARLFLDGKPDEVEAQARRLRDGRSILDAVREQSRGLQPGLGSADRDKLDEYFTSVRELEQRLAVSEEWARKPKPKVDAKQPQNIMNPADILGRTRLMYDLVHLALQTDSTRVISLMLSGVSQVPLVPGVSLGHHDLSHHGQDPAKIDQLKKVETEELKLLRDLLLKLKATKETDASLLDRTAVFFSSNLGSAASHSVTNLPVILAGGGFKHGQHLAFDPAKPPPLANLYVSMLRRTGVAVEKFGSGSGPLPGLDVAD